MMTYMIVGGVMVTWIAVISTLVWFGIVGDIDALGKNTFYGHSHLVEQQLLVPMFSYQLWNTVVCLAWRELRQPQMIAHHLLVLGLCTFAIDAAYLHYFAVVFWLPVCAFHFSSVFLARVNVPVGTAALSVSSLSPLFVRIYIAHSFCFRPRTSRSFRRFR